MQKTMAFVCFVGVLGWVLIFTPSAQAVELEVTRDGNILLFQDGVLGDSTDSYFRKIAQRPSQEIRAARGNKVRISAEENDVNVKVVNDAGIIPATRPGEETELDETEAKRLRAQFPADTDRPRSDRAKETINDDAPGAEYRKKLIEQRLDREDQIEVSSSLDETGDQELQVRTGSARARLRGADFTFDPDTNMITITTPSGNKKTLYHLPDQALAKMKERVIIQNTDPSAPTFDIETDQEDRLYYRTKGIQQRKFLGLFNRPIETEVILDDETGQVVSVEKPSPGVLGQFLDAFTF